MKMSIRAFATVALLAVGPAFAGPLNPPAGPVAPTHKTLTEVEPRIAVNATNTPGDGLSIYTISQPGSYYLTGNINGGSGRIGVRILADSVTLDLNGFAVIGVPGALVGVGDTGNTSRQNITVKNGVVSGWPGGGVRFFKFGASRAHLYQDLIVRDNGIGGTAAGIECRDAAVVVRCVASNNTGAGFNTADGGLYESCIAMSNGGRGFDLGFGISLNNCVARGNTISGFSGSDMAFANCEASQNTVDGFTAIGRCSLENCHAGFNGAWGVNASSGSTIRGCTVANNTTGGILVGGSSIVSECQVTANSVGIRATGGDCRIEDNNVAAGATCFDISSNGSFIARNTASGGSVARFTIVGTHTVGPIVTATGTITTTSPWANFEY